MKFNAADGPTSGQEGSDAAAAELSDRFMAEKHLEVIEQKEVAFYGDELTAIRGSDGHIYVSIRHLCDALGIDTQAQVRRIRRQNVLLRGLQRVAIMTPQRGQQQTYMLRADLVPLCLSGISTRAVNEDIRSKLEKFQEEAAAVLWEAFQDGRLTADPTFNTLLAQEDNPSVQAYKIAAAIMKMAQQQILLESRVDSHERRIEELESIVGDTRHHVTPGQAAQISQAVKAVAMALGKQTGRNEYGGVYGELYRRFEITSYKLLPKNKFDDAMGFLTDWYARVTGSRDLPF